MWMPIVVPVETGTHPPPAAVRYHGAAMKIPCVYILASIPNGTIYIGVTSNPVRRVWQHKNGFVDGFTKEYDVDRLVWYETHPTMEAAITRERQLKKWNRAWKIRLIEEANPSWRDLYSEIT